MKQLGWFFLCCSFITSAHAYELATSASVIDNAGLVAEIGAFDAQQGRAQKIEIQSLIGDYFTLTQQHDENLLLGFGYFFNGIDYDQFHLQYGINAYYLPNSVVKGNVIQEDIFTNLSYRYSITNYPIYAMLKGLLHSNSDHEITANVGLGANVIKTSNFRENSLDHGITLPDNIFTDDTQVAFSATAGIGVRFNHLIKNHLLEIGYRFFYLGKGHLSAESNQVLNTLDTGNSYANAVVASIIF